MCCIFTCCGWMIDLIQRLWTFTMSCCISSAVCCALVTASMSGIALGYNYSLAEYIDLKETNVSVYLKRGVFDDEIADDIDWRRSGHMPVQGHLRDNNLMTAPPENEEMPLRSGRRMDDSVVVSDDQHKFEGSLMRLTVKPPSYRSSIQPVTSDIKMQEVLAEYPKGSLEQMKAIHGLLNQRRANTQRNTMTTNTRHHAPPDFNGRRIGGIAPGGVPMFHGPYDNEVPFNINPARLGLPDPNIGQADNWMLPGSKVPESYRRTMDPDEYPNDPKIYTYPSAIIFTAEMKRPTRPMQSMRPTSKPSILKEIFREGADSDAEKNLPEDEVQMFKAQLMEDKQNFERLRLERLRKEGEKVFTSEDDYAEQANKGLPIRKKRALASIITHHDNLDKNLNYLPIVSGKILSQVKNSQVITTTRVFKNTMETVTSKQFIESLNTETKDTELNSHIKDVTTSFTSRDDHVFINKLNRKPVNLDGINKISESVLLPKINTVRNGTIPILISNVTSSESSTGITGILKSLLSSSATN